MSSSLIDLALPMPVLRTFRLFFWGLTQDPGRAAMASIVITNRAP
jgi:hypothetical protein